jgi:D-cysteine desulfhydrase family pyridoxal phosphate-dependent enzyme
MTTLDQFPRVSLAHLPTPLEEAPRLTAALGGPRILIKRDDLTGLALGGNKARKLEFLLASALAEGANTVITTGAADSNHCRMTAAAAQRLGLRCVLLLGATVDDPPYQGNLLLDRLFDAELHFYDARQGLMGNRILPRLTEYVRDRGDRPYAFASGGSVGLGALGYALMYEELCAQLEAQGITADHVVFASGSSGTHAGLLLGAALFGERFHILAINVDEPTNDELEERTRLVYTEGAALLGLTADRSMPSLDLRAGYVGEGYGIMSTAGAEAIELLARTEGILLDPVYTGKAMAGLIDLTRRGELGPDQTVIFVHTGGAPALFTQAGTLVERAGLRPAELPRWWAPSGDGW